MKYNWILVIKKTGKYLGWSKSEKAPACGEPDKLDWIKWDKELPEDIDDNEYFLKKGKLSR